MPAVFLSIRDQMTDIMRVFGLTLYYVFRRRWHMPTVWKQMFEIGNRSLFFIIVTMGFLGAILNFQAGFQAMRIIGDNSLLGAATMPMLIRQLGPSLAGLMIATRVGTGIAAEIGSMVVTEQVDALRMCNAQPVDYLVKPRFIACMVMVPLLTVIAVAASWAAGMWTSYTVFHINPSTYINFDLVKSSDIFEGLSKAVMAGAVVPIIAGASGLTARGGSAGVGRATTQAVVNSSLAVIILGFLIGGVWFAIRTAP